MKPIQPIARVLASSIVLAMTFAACAPSSSSSGPTPFQFQTSSQAPVLVRVRLDGTALPFCPIQIQPNAQGAMVYYGATNAAGVMQAELPVPIEADEVVLVVQYPGARGEHDDEAFALDSGPFAPSARKILAPEELSDLTIELTSEEN